MCVTQRWMHCWGPGLRAILYVLTLRGNVFGTFPWRYWPGLGSMYLTANLRQRDRDKLSRPITAQAIRVDATHTITKHVPVQY